MFEAVHQFRGDGGSLRCVLPRPKLHLAGNLHCIVTTATAVILLVPILLLIPHYYFHCRYQGILSQNQMEALTDKQLMEKHRTFRLNTGKCPVIFLSSSSDQSDVCSPHVIRIISPITGCWLLIAQYSPEKLLSAPSHNLVTRT